MLYAYWSICIIVILMYAIGHQKSQMFKKFCLFLVFIFLFIMSGWARGAYDVEIGISRFINYSRFESITEIGFSTLIQFAYKFGFNYRSFYVLCSLLELIVMLWFVEKNCPKSPIVFFLFLIYPLTVYLQYTRNVLAMAFIYMAFDALLNKPKRYIIKYCLLVLLASSIHLSSLFFGVFLILDVMNRKNVIIGTVALFVILYMARGLQLYESVIIDFIGKDKADIVLGTTSADGAFGRSFSVAFTIVMFFLIFFILERVYKIDLSDRNAQLLYKINFFFVILIPLSINYGVGFARIITLFLPLNFVFYVDRISKIKGQKRRLAVYSIVVLFLVGSWILSFRNEEYRRLVLIPFFEQNELMYRLMN